MRIIGITLLSYFVLMVPTIVLAAPLTLEQAIAQAKQRNPYLHALRNEQAIGEQQVTQATAAWLPRVDLSGGWTTQKEPQAMTISSVTMETQDKNYRFGSAAVQQTLFDFGRRSARISAMEHLRDGMALTVTDRAQDVALQVVTSYLGILQSDAMIASLEREQATVIEHKRIAKALFDAGSVTRNDLLQAEVRLASVNQRLLTTTVQRETLYLQLAFLTGSTPTERPTLTAPTAPGRELSNLSPDRIKIRPDIKALSQQVAASDALVREQNRSFYPELYARLSADYLENSHLREQTVLGATIGLKFNLFDGFSTSAGKAKAVLESTRAKDQLAALEQQAILELNTARQELQVAEQRISVTKVAISQAQENLRINQNRYQERVGTASDVLDAQTLLSQTETDNLQAVYEYQRAIARVKRAVGEL